MDTCEVLNSSLKAILDQSWNIGENTPIKGYNLRIISEEKGTEIKEILLLNKGEKTGNSKGSTQEFVKRGNSFQVFFTIYY